MYIQKFYHERDKLGLEMTIKRKLELNVFICKSCGRPGPFRRANFYNVLTKDHCQAFKPGLPQFDYKDVLCPNCALRIYNPKKERACRIARKMMVKQNAEDQARAKTYFDEHGLPEYRKEWILDRNETEGP